MRHALLGDADLDLVWLDRPEALLPLQAEWQALADRVGADLFAMPDWVDLWWQHFGAGRKSVCLIARRNGTLVGVLPFCLETIWIGPLPLRIARLAGTDPHCIIFKLAVENEVAPDLLNTAVQHLTERLGCHAVSFTPVSDLSEYLPHVRQLCREGSGLALCEEGAGSHVIFELPAQFEDYLATLTRTRRARFRKNLAALQSLCKAENVTDFPNADRFADFVSFHNQHWQAIGRGGHFEDWPGSTAFYTALADRLSPSGRLRVDMLTAPGGPLAATFSLATRQTCYARLPARSLDPEAEKLSVGIVGFVLLMQNLIKDGVTRIEAGRGEYGYKLDYGGQSVAVHRLIVSPATLLGRLRLRALLAWADGLDLLYYRIWFLKLAPRLRKLVGGKLIASRPRPLWRCWIRSRL